MRVIIAGGSPLSVEIAKQLLERALKRVTLIIEDKEEAMRISTEESRLTVVNGSPVNPEVLGQLELDHCDVFVAATGKDETSVLSALFAKKYMIGRIYVQTMNGDTKAILENLEMFPIDTFEEAAHNVVLGIAEPHIADLVGIGRGGFDIREKGIEEFRNLVGKRVGDIEGNVFSVLAVFQDGHFELSADTIVGEEASLIIIEESGKDEDVIKLLKKMR